MAVLGVSLKLVRLMPRIILDFETASTVDLKVCGAAVYSEHPNTEVLCLVSRFEGGDMDMVWSPWLPEYAKGLERLCELAEDQTVTFVSHGTFEQFIWKNIMVPLGMPELPVERWEDIQATAAWRSMPLQHEKLSKVLDLSIQKDMVGSRLTIGLSKPNKKTGMLDRSRPTIERVVEYCKTDVAGEEMVLHKVGSLSKPERMVWELDQEINHRGVRIDLDFVRRARLVVDRATVPLLEEFRDLTGGTNPGQVAEVIKWAGTQGVELENLQKGYLNELLGASEEIEDESLAGDGDDGAVPRPELFLPADVRRALEIRGMLGSASIKKLARMQRCVCGDGRVRGLLQYHGTHPGLWGGRLIQPQNFPKGGVVDAAGNKVDHVAAIMSGDPNACRFFKKKQDLSLAPIEAIETVAMSLANAIIADDDKLLCVGDYSGIQARFVLGMAGQHDKTELIAKGLDAYLDFACLMFHKPAGFYTKEDVAARQLGKQGVLGSGFQCGYDNFNFKFLGNKDLPNAILAVDTYRKVWAPKVPDMWKVFKDVATDCVRNGRTARVYGCCFRRDGDYMAIDLPSGWSTIWFYRPHMHDRGDYGPSPAYWAMKQGQWTRIHLYGGLLTENIVMACQRAVLVSAMGRLTKAGFPLVLNVHDEAICEVPKAHADVDRFKAIMEEHLDWVEAMKVPINVDAWVAPRYHK